ncbi:MAG: phosphatidylglycerophosphatase A [Verrucomicrobiota bacterium]
MSGRDPAKYYPWTRVLPTPLVLGVATLGPIGTKLKAPGTMGSIAGIVWYTVAFHYTTPLGYVLLLALSVYVAIAFCGEAEVRLYKRDPGEVILDELVAVPLCFFGLQGAISALGPWAWTVMLGGFALFRFFDILKPLGIRKLQELPGGAGVVVDDLAAALATCLVLHAVIWLAVF